MEIMSRLRLGLIIAFVVVWVLFGVIQFGKLQGLYEISMILWFASLVLLIAGLIVKEKDKRNPQNSTKS